MTLHIPISDQTEARLRERAAARGEDLAVVAARLLDEAAGNADVDEVLAPFRRQVAESGLSDDDLDSFYSDLRDRVWRDQQGQSAETA